MTRNVGLCFSQWSICLLSWMMSLSATSAIAFARRYAAFWYFYRVMSGTELLLLPPITNPASTALECSCQIKFSVLPWRDNALLLAPSLPVCIDFGIEMDLHFFFVKYRMLCAAFVQCFVYCRHFLIVRWFTHMQCGRSATPDLLQVTSSGQ